MRMQFCLRLLRDKADGTGITSDSVVNVKRKPIIKAYTGRLARFCSRQQSYNALWLNQMVFYIAIRSHVSFLTLLKIPSDVM